MIPKTIHFAWFSKEEKPSAIKKCLESWKRELPDFEIMEWNLDNFRAHNNQWCKDAIELKKWAFVTDYFRLWVMYNFGGIYLDADIEVRANFTPLLTLNTVIFGLEDFDHIGPHCILAEPKHPIFQELLGLYNKPFIKNNGFPDLTPMPQVISKKISQYSKSDKTITIVAANFFTVDIADDKNFCVHHMAGSWINANNEVINFKEQFLRQFLFFKQCKREFSFSDLTHKQIRLLKILIILIRFILPYGMVQYIRYIKRRKNGTWLEWF